MIFSSVFSEVKKYPKNGKVQFGKDVFFECHSLKTVVQLPAAKWVFVVWALGNSRNRKNWQLTTLKNSKNLLILISRFAVEKHQFKVDPYVLSSPYNVPRRQVMTPLVPIVIPWFLLFYVAIYYTDKTGDPIRIRMWRSLFFFSKTRIIFYTLMRKINKKYNSDFIFVFSITCIYVSAFFFQLHSYIFRNI